MAQKQLTIWLAGGGTGGHISPAIAMFEYFKQKGLNTKVVTLEKNKNYPSIVNLENTNINSKPVIYYNASGIPKSLKAMYFFFKTLLNSFKVLNRECLNKAPDAILAFGGYPVFPVLLWAIFHRIPYYLHEQNSVHGFITRLFTFKSKRIFLSFPQKHYSPKTMLTGNPLRSMFLYSKTVRPLGKSNTTARKILIIGGSQGAKDVNNLYLEIIQDSYFKSSVITISTGNQDWEHIQRAARKQDKVLSFIEDMPAALMSNDLIISRAGSGSIYEIIWSGKPACFLPYPHAAADHQKHNVLALMGKGQYFILDIRPFDPHRAVEMLKEYLSGMDKQKGSSKSNQDDLPLNAHEVIFRSILEDLS